MQKADADDSLVISYLSLRKAVGIIGFALPFVLAIGKILSGDPGIEPSISHYYYTNMGDVFVGSLCAIGVFLMSTRGYSDPKFAGSLGQDHFFGILTGIFAIGVALIPTNLNENELTLRGYVHLAFAALLFLTLAYFCLKLFTKTAGNPTRQKLKRNKVYRVSGYTILASILLIAVAAIPRISAMVEPLNPRFWLESVAVLAFAVAWLTKGEVILKDEEDQTFVSSPSKSAAASTL
ncbi:MAG TPA: DUF998 domain-containing protein [Candidatus Angelobacter sp.]|nr:DUF998 domain-containing protein [Candidatus Angelobacter sp.]